ncbi:MAG: hypothetical protein H6731_02265 [Myxococcales bacterium]|nr:MAG: hypothetical protein H6731_02265 [Myxococcales bacterium]
MEEQLIEIFVKVDDFCKVYEERLRYMLKEFGFKKRFCSDTLSLSELMTIAIFFQCSQVRTFKAFYFLLLCSRFKDFFPRLPSYQRLTLLPSKIALPIEIFLTVN